ncbi:MAG: DUF6529 family protein [Lapillicoccus sp.]
MTASDIERADQATPNRSALAVLAVPVVVGVGVAVALGVYGSLHESASYAISIAGFSSGAVAKSWLATAAIVLAIVQLVTGAGMWGWFGLGDRAWVAPLHHWSGRLAILATLPVVTHCLYAFGFEHDNPRVLAHSLLGCLFFGAFTTKMLALQSKSMPGWALPVLGGLLFSALAGLWLSSALWFFTTTGTFR